MVRTANDVTEAELDILRILWELGFATIREVVDRLYDEPTRNNYQTTKKLVSRLEGKKLVGRTKSGTAHTFLAERNRSHHPIASRYSLRVGPGTDHQVPVTEAGEFFGASQVTSQLTGLLRRTRFEIQVIIPSSRF